jgi:hypothetical protein
MTASWSALVLSSTGAVVWKLTLAGSANVVASTSVLGLNAAFAGKSGSVYQSTVNVPLTVTLSPPKRLTHPPVKIYPKS